MNKANFTSFVDAEGGEWIRFKGTKFEGVVWRPSELGLSDDGDLSFQVEVLEGAGFPEVAQGDWQDFGKICSSILSDIIAVETAELQTIAEAAEEQQVQQEAVQTQDFSQHSFFEGENAMQVSDAMIPQDLQADLAQVSQFMGGVKPLAK